MNVAADVTSLTMGFVGFSVFSMGCNSKPPVGHTFEGGARCGLYLWALENHH